MVPADHHGVRVVPALATDSPQVAVPVGSEHVARVVGAGVPQLHVAAGHGLAVAHRPRPRASIAAVEALLKGCTGIFTLTLW